MRVVVVPALSDNYSYLIIDEKTGKAACVDPVEPEKVLEHIVRCTFLAASAMVCLSQVLKAAEKENVDIQCVLTTHNHWDHAGGNSSFKKLRPGYE
jgi:hydroxyacylglutathione hydrolase